MNTRRIQPSLLIGDGVAILLFAFMGRAEHQTGINISGVLSTALPFLIAWYPVAFWLRAFRPDTLDRPLVAARRTAVAWLLAWPLGLQLRALFLDRSIPFSFAVVVLVTNLILLIGWRSLYARYRNRREP